jgi:putative MATE family efflux protein
MSEHAPTYRKIWNIAFPIIAGGLAENIINITDTAFVGRLGEKPLGAVGMGSLYYYTFVLVAMGLAMGTQILIGRRNGEKNYPAIGLLFDNSLYLFACIAIFLFIVLHFLSPFLLPLLIRSPEIYDMAGQYINIRSYGILFVCLTQIFKAFHVGITRTRIIIYITLSMAIINAFFNYLMIFGKGGFSPMGVRGSATASLIAEATALTGYMLFTVFTKANRKYHVLKFGKPRLKLAFEIIKVGFPLMLQGWVSVSSWFVFFMLIEKMGELPLAVSSIIKSIYIVFMIPIWGYGSATNTLVSNAMGAGEHKQVPFIIRKVITLSILTTAVLGVINIFFPHEVIYVFNREGAIIGAATAPLQVITLALLILSSGSVLFNAVSGSGATRIALFIELITLSFYMIYVLIATLELHLGLAYVWMSEWVYMTSMALFSLLYLMSGRWKKIKL